MSTFWWLIASLPAILVVSAIASGSETALFSLTRADRERLRSTRPTAAALVSSLLARPRRLLVLVLLINMLANVSYFVISAMATTTAETPAAAVVVGVGSVIAVVMFGEVFAKLLAQRYRVRVSALLAGPAVVLTRVLMPIIGLIESGVIVPAQRLASPGAGSASGLSSREVQRVVRAAASEGDLLPGEHRLLADVLELGRVRAGEVMTPRVDTPAVSARAERDEVLAIVRACRRMHLPVCDDGPAPRVLGVLDVRRYLAAAAGSVLPLAVSARPVFIPETARLDAVLLRMRQAGVSLAVCVDEHGSYVGTIETEDIVAELLGQLGEDEPDEIAQIEQAGPNVWTVPGALALRDASVLTGRPSTPIRRGAHTIAGLLMRELGRVPGVGDTLELPGVRLTVEAVSDRRVSRVRIELVENPEQSAGDRGKAAR